jgi:hypothetical protein
MRNQAGSTALGSAEDSAAGLTEGSSASEAAAGAADVVVQQAEVPASKDGGKKSEKSLEAGDAKTTDVVAQQVEVPESHETSNDLPKRIWSGTNFSPPLAG